MDGKARCNMDDSGNALLKYGDYVSKSNAPSDFPMGPGSVVPVENPSRGIFVMIFFLLNYRIGLV